MLKKVCQAPYCRQTDVVCSFANGGQNLQGRHSANYMHIGLIFVKSFLVCLLLEKHCPYNPLHILFIIPGKLYISF